MCAAGQISLQENYRSYVYPATGKVEERERARASEPEPARPVVGVAERGRQLLGS